MFDKVLVTPLDGHLAKFFSLERMLYFNPLTPGVHQKNPYILIQTCSFQLQIYLSAYDFLVDTKR